MTRWQTVGLVGLGVYMLILAGIFASLYRPDDEPLYTDRDFSNFAGDVEHWLRTR